MSILSRSGDLGAADARSACAEIAARIVKLEEALRALMAGEVGAGAAANRILLDG